MLASGQKFSEKGAFQFGRKIVQCCHHELGYNNNSNSSNNNNNDK